MFRTAATILLGAFLLFLVQPLLGRHLLPVFGGSPAVWNACLLFFQVLLLLGYAYAHWLDLRLSSRWQAIVHLALTGAALCVLGLQAGSWDAPLLVPLDASSIGRPVVAILLALTLAVGLPFLLLSSTSPLLQAWFHRCDPGRSPYRLYAISNIGSMLALLAYPFGIEPLLGLESQGWAWAGAFAAFAAGSAWCAVRLLGARAPAAAESSAELSGETGPRPRAGQMALWMLASAIGASMLLAATNQICQEIAVTPFLWVLPLLVYLLSFVLTFQYEGLYTRRYFGPVFWLGAVVAVFALLEGPSLDVPLQIASFLLCLFGCCMVCHGELVYLKPRPRHLTAFYFAVSLGGAAGGAFVTLLAPVVFSGYWELHSTLLACGIFFFFQRRAHPEEGTGAPSWTMRTFHALLLVALGGLLFYHMQAYELYSVEARRGFYGVLRVEKIDRENAEQSRYLLRHGRTFHGAQYPALRHLPTTYYGPYSGGALAITAHPRRKAGQPMRIGIVGLGVGTLAVYGKRGDRFRFFEIHPDVIALARGEGGYFSYLGDSPARIEVSEGDGRLLLERCSERFHVLVLDAFSSNSVPVHLLTEEAFTLYLRRLEPDGWLAVHVTNQHLDLERLIVGLAARFDLGAVHLLSGDHPPWTRHASWIILTPDPDLLERAGLTALSSGYAFAPVEPWTDRKSDLFELLR
ncbi:MAG: fused MFS/spermidine synthase [Deltaproteobacteria bacterium]|nr:fused MFS/spermidine synthase [Deltaproteobacteria bacterium]